MQQVEQSFQVDAGLAPVPLQQRKTLKAFEKAHPLGPRKGNVPQRNVGEDLDTCPAPPDEHGVPKERVAVRAEDEFNPFSYLFLHQYPTSSRKTGEECVNDAAERLLVRDVQHYAARVRLVEHVGVVYLRHDGVEERSALDLFRRGDHGGEGERNAVCFQKLLAERRQKETVRGSGESFP